MEGKNLYEESYNELNRIHKELSQTKVTIDFSKLDSESSNLIKQNILIAVSARIPLVTAVISKPE